jgi:hypothetical protein
MGCSVWDKLADKGVPATQNIPGSVQEKLQNLFPGMGGTKGGGGFGSDHPPFLQVGQNMVQPNLFSNLFSGLGSLASDNTTVFGATSSQSFFVESSAGSFTASSTSSIFGSSSPDGSFLAAELSGEYSVSLNGNEACDPIVFGGSYSYSASVAVGNTDLVGGMPISVDPTLVEGLSESSASLVEDPTENDDDDLFKSYKGQA